MGGRGSGRKYTSNGSTGPEHPRLKEFVEGFMRTGTLDGEIMRSMQAHAREQRGRGDYELDSRKGERRNGHDRAVAAARGHGTSVRAEAHGAEAVQESPGHLVDREPAEPQRHQCGRDRRGLGDAGAGAAGVRAAAASHGLELGEAAE